MKTVIIPLLAGALLVGGCGRLGRLARADPVAVVEQKSLLDPKGGCPLVTGVGGGKALAIDLDCYRFPNDQASYEADIVQAEDARGAGIPPPVFAPPARPLTAYAQAIRHAEARNRLEAVLLRHADAMCEASKGQFFANEAGLGTAFDVTASTFSTASSIVGGEQAKSILSAIAGLSTATRSHITANVYKNQIVPAITNVIDGERKAILTRLQGRHVADVTDYPVDEMIWMVNGYHQACSFQNGVQVLLRASVNKAGSDAIIQSINLQFALTKLTAELSAYKGRNEGMTAASDPIIADYEKRIQEVTLQLLAISKEADGAANTAVAPETHVPAAADGATPPAPAQRAKAAAPPAAAPAAAPAVRRPARRMTAPASPAASAGAGRQEAPVER